MGKVGTPDNEFKLTEKQRLFCHEYIIHWNGAKAAREAGYSKDIAKVIASENLTKPNLLAYIEHIQKNIAKEAGISALSQVLELKKIAYSNIADLFQGWDKLEDFNNLTAEQKGAILEISYKKELLPGTDVEAEFVKLKMHSKLEAIKEINKMLGFLAPEQKNISITENDFLTSDDFEDN